MQLRYAQSRVLTRASDVGSVKIAQSLANKESNSGVMKKDSALADISNLVDRTTQVEKTKELSHKRIVSYCPSNTYFPS